MSNGWLRPKMTKAMEIARKQRTQLRSFNHSRNDSIRCGWKEEEEWKRGN